MSWDGYIDHIISGTNAACDRACIIGLNGGGTWTTDAHASALKISPEEAVTIAAALASEDCTTFQTKGIMLGGVKYQFLRTDPEEGTVYGKMKEQGAITIQKSNTAIIMAHTAEGKPQGSTNKGVLNVVNYLKGLNM